MPAVNDNDVRIVPQIGGAVAFRPQREPLRWDWLMDLIRKHDWRLGVEVGVFWGKNLFHLLMMNPRLTMCAVDPWVEQPEGNQTYAEHPMELGATTVTFYAAELFAGRVIIARDFSTKVAEKIGAGVDFVFLDGQHDYASVKADIAAWRGKCKFLCGHDYSDEFPGVIQAVDEAFPSGVMLGPDTTWGVWTR